MRNPIFKLVGVSEEIRHASQGGRGILMLFTLFVVISVGLSFACWYILFNNSGMQIIGFIVGIVAAMAILMLDKGLFADGKQLIIAVIIRIVFITLLAFITSTALGVAMADSTLKSKIKKSDAREKKEFFDQKALLDKAYRKEIDAINDRMLTDIRKNPKNADEIRSVYTEMKSDKESEHIAQIDLLKEINPEAVRYSEYGIWQKLVAYNNLPSHQRNSGLYWLFFIIEMLPLVLRLAYKIVEDD